MCLWHAHPFFLASSILLSACVTQVARCRGNHTTDISRYADHLEALAHAFSRGLAIAAKDARGDVVFPCSRPNTLQGLYKFGFSPFAAWCETKLSVQIVRPDECYIYSWYREDVIEILKRLFTLNLDDHDNFIVRRLRII